MPKFFGVWNERLTALGGGCRPFALRWSLWETLLMKANPILEEVWRIKDELAREAGYDIHRLCENTRKWAASQPHSGPIVRDAKELRQLAAEGERKCAENAALTLKDEPPPRKP
jgi:hypothetical protein